METLNSQKEPLDSAEFPMSKLYPIEELTDQRTSSKLSDPCAKKDEQQSTSHENRINLGVSISNQDDFTNQHMDEDLDDEDISVDKEHQQLLEKRS